MAQCTARSKQSKERCKKDAVVGYTVCHIHGGKTPRGIAASRYTTGRYSKVLPTRLAARYAEAEDDARLLELDQEIRLLDARLGDVLGRVDTGESGALWSALKAARVELRATQRNGSAADQLKAFNRVLELIDQGYDDYRAWGEVQALLEQRKRLVESERKRKIELQQTLSIEKAMLLIGAIGGIVKAHVTDRAQLAAISADISALVAHDPGE
jgi:hypothetical protein